MRVIVVQWDSTSSTSPTDHRWVVREHPEPYDGHGYVVGPATKHSRANADRLAAWLNDREGIHA